MKAPIMAPGSVLVVSLRGPLTSVLDPGTIPEQLKPLVRLHGPRAILDMGAVAAVDCSGIGLLVTLYCRMREAGGSVKLLNLRPRPRMLLEACGLHEVFPMFESEEAALTSLVGLDPSELYLDRTRLHLGASSSSRGFVLPSACPLNPLRDALSVRERLYRGRGAPL